MLSCGVGVPRPTALHVDPYGARMKSAVVTSAGATLTS
jgi:hypothetical protein